MFESWPRPIQFVTAAPSCTSRIAPFVPESWILRYDEVLPPGDRKASSTVPDFTTIRAGAFVFVPPTVQVLFVAPRRSFTTSHS